VGHRVPSHFNWSLQMEIMYNLFIYPSYMPSRYGQRQHYLYLEVCQTVT